MQNDIRLILCFSYRHGIIIAFTRHNLNDKGLKTKV